MPVTRKMVPTKALRLLFVALGGHGAVGVSPGNATSSQLALSLRVAPVEASNPGVALLEWPSVAVLEWECMVGLSQEIKETVLTMKTGIQLLKTMLKAFATFVMEHISEGAGLAELCSDLASLITPVDTKPLTERLCEVVLGKFLNVLKRNRLTMGCWRTKFIAFGLALELEFVQDVKLISRRIGELVSEGIEFVSEGIEFTEEWFSDMFVPDTNSPYSTCQRCCPALRAAEEVGWNLKPCDWLAVAQCAYKDSNSQCDKVLGKMVVHTRSASFFVSMCECHCCLAGETVLEHLDKLPGTGSREPGDFTTIALRSVDWANVTSHHKPMIQNLMCATRDFSECVASRKGCCDCGHWNTVGLMREVFARARQLEYTYLGDSCGRLVGPPDTCPVYPGSRCGSSSVSAAHGHRFLARKAIIISFIVAVGV